FVLPGMRGRRQHRRPLAAVCAVAATCGAAGLHALRNAASDRVAFTGLSWRSSALLAAEVADDRVDMHRDVSVNFLGKLFGWNGKQEVATAELQKLEATAATEVEAQLSALKTLRAAAK
ncbi:unnamed protein product, partial [Polarella glacialis]